VWVHVAALLAWAVLLVSSQARILSARRRGGPARELDARRALRPVVLAEHVCLCVALASGLAVLGMRGWGPGRARWLGLKLGLVAFLLVPLEAMHVYIWHGWVGPGLRQTAAPPFAKELERGIGMEDMLRALGIPLLGLAIPLLVYLSLVKPSW
jgi:hypothetical protein